MNKSFIVAAAAMTLSTAAFSATPQENAAAKEAHLAAQREGVAHKQAAYDLQKQKQADDRAERQKDAEVNAAAKADHIAAQRAGVAHAADAREQAAVKERQKRDYLIAKQKENAAAHR